jgi:predicted metal-dependent hydrolase
MTSLECKLQYGNTTINYTVIKSGRGRKTSEIIVKKDGKVTVRAPLDKPISDIEGFIQKNAKWILRKQLEYKN